ncbi:unnamed protein product [Rotaria sordida]|uniref:Tesmin/TSO1-like CXC domain-containing protein n=1 Tax=Rotaria sordida TaxID=392033 RepID=A0A815R980_9BILA|nr:unnamed protein product [Rotaria sordida]
MPSEVIHCVLCDRRERGARSKFTTITTVERQQKVYEAYEKRHGRPLNYSLINKKVHCSCYHALTFSFRPVSVMNRTGRPKLYKRPRRCNLTTTNISATHQSSFIKIQRNYSHQNEPQSSSVELNVNMEMGNDYYSEKENDNILNNHLMTTIENTSSLNICSSSCYQQPLVDRSNQDIELDFRTRNDGSSLQLDNIDIFPMSPINKKRTSNITFAMNDLNAQRSNVINVISAAGVDDDSFEIASMTPGGTQTDDDNNNCQSSEDQDCYIECATPTIFSSNSIQNYSMTPRKINSNEEDEYVILKNKYEKKNVRAYRAKTGTTSSSRRSHRIQSKFHQAPPCPQIKNCSGLFATAFDELCSWLIDLLHSGLIVSMIDISTEYRIIAERRKENPKANMFRTSSIQKRIKFKYGDKLYFYKQSNNENSSSYLFSRMEKAFAVTRSHRKFSIALSLCDRDNVDFFNQQSKSTAIDFLRKIFPSSFSSSYPLSAVESALVIDGCSLFDTKPNPEAKTIRDYAIQLLDKNIRFLFESYHRIDVVFDTVESNTLKQSIKIHGRNNNNSIYHLRGDDRLQLPFRKFVHCHRVVLAKCIRQCWMEPDLIKYLPLGRLLVIGGPDTTAVKLQNGQAPQVDYLLESNHTESRTRLLLHTNIISLDQLQKTVIIDTTDTDVILVAIALGSTIMLHHLIIKSTNTRTEKNTFIDVKSIATGLRRAAIDPICLLVLHSLSGCDTTSFIKNITKEKVFNRFFDYPDQYSSINKLNCISPPYEAITACEQLLIHCYSFGRMVHSLDELRAMMAEVRMKDRSRTNIASSLPPSTSSFHQHCLRAARQVKIWIDCLNSNPTTLSMLDSGYKSVDGTDRFKIKWSDFPDQPSDFRLITCGDCKSNCRRCKCWKSNISCTIYCKCNVDSCINQPSAQNITSLTSNDFHIDDSSDDVRSTDTSIQSNRACDDHSFISDSDSIYNQTDDSEIYMDNYDRTNDELNLNNCVIRTSTAALQDNLSLHILHDHNYSVDDSNNDSILNFFSTPKRRRTATMTSDIYDTSTPCSSPLIHSTPKTQTTTSSTTTIFVNLNF